MLLIYTQKLKTVFETNVFRTSTNLVLYWFHEFFSGMNCASRHMKLYRSLVMDRLKFDKFKHQRLSITSLGYLLKQIPLGIKDH